MYLRDLKGRFASKKYLKLIGYIWLIAMVLAGVAYVLERYAGWRAEHQWQNPILISTRSIITRVEKEKIVISPIVAVEKETEFTPTEQKIIDKWGFRDGIVALAIFDCGESGLDQYAVSRTGDLGISQINWPTWKKTIEERFKYNASDMFDVDKNIDVAYLIWDRGNGQEGDKVGNWNAWVGFTSGGYTRCFK